MSNLFWKQPDKKAVNVAERPFKTEEELEKYLHKQGEIISDIFLIKRQIRANQGRDIPDVIGVDRENNIVILEIKNVELDENIVPQVLRYAIWAETNPDSIKALWLEVEDKPEDIELSWDNLSVRIIIIAPKIKSNVPRLINKINYDVELLKIQRFGVEGNEFIIVETIEVEDRTSQKPTRGLIAYDKEFYKESRNNKSVDLFFETIESIENYTKSKGWDLETKFNKYYVGFKHGFFNVFGVKWLSTKSLGVFFKVPEEITAKLVKKQPKKYRDDSRWGEVVYRIGENEKFKPKKLDFLFDEAHKSIVGL